MSTVALITHSDCGRHDTGWQHPEHPGRLRTLPRALRDEPELWAALQHVEARLASVEELEVVHTREYIRSIRDFATAGGGRIEEDTVLSEGSWPAALAAAGAVLSAVDLARSGVAARSFCAIRPPGHHALPGAAMGFCVFGNVALGAHYARRVAGFDRVLIVDWDVHHGNGTQAMIAAEPDIRFVSMHQWPWYPGTGAASERGSGNVWNVPMAAGLAPERYVEALEGAIDEATRDFRPDLVMISAGFDSLRGDPLGGFTLELEHIATLTRALVERAEQWCGGRVVSSLEGGYAPDRLAQAIVTHLGALL